MQNYDEEMCEEPRLYVEQLARERKTQADREALGKNRENLRQEAERREREQKASAYLQAREEAREVRAGMHMCVLVVSISVCALFFALGFLVGCFW